MERTQCQVGMTVRFGRFNGEHTLGVIVKLNPTKAKVRTLEQRGAGRGSAVGTEWNVPYTMLWPNSAESVNIAAPKLTYHPFDHVENLILEAIFTCYNRLSPENLYADGEASITAVRSNRARLERQLRGLWTAYGRNVSEDEVYDWWQSKREYELRRQEANAL